MPVNRNISAFSVILVFICLSLVGLALIPVLPVRLSPSQTLPQLSVSFSMPGGSPRTVEVEATSRLEAMLNRMDGVQRITSRSGSGWGSIQVVFNKHKDPDMARFEASTIIRQTWPLLPEQVSYPVISQSRADQDAHRPFLTYTIHAAAVPYAIQQFAEETLKPGLALMEGVSQVDIRGAMPMVWLLEYDADVLAAYGVTIRNIQEAVSEAFRHEFLDMAFVTSPTGINEWLRVTLRSPDQPPDAALKQIGLKQLDGTLIPLDKIVRIRRVEQQPQSYFRINGLNSVYLSVTADEQSNQLALGKKIKHRLAAMKKTLPPGYEIHLNYDATEYISNELGRIYFRTGLTLAILLLFILLTYRNFRYLLLITVSLFTNLAAALILYYLLGLEIQLYSLAGITISLTLIIDNTIVMAEHLIREKNLRSFTSVLAATLTTIGTLSVIFLLDEKRRLHLQDFATVIIVNLCISLLVALFLVPALVEKLHIHRVPARSSSRFGHAYAALCRFMYRWKKTAVLLMVLAFGLPVFLLPERVEGESVWAGWYNRTLGTEWYKEQVSPHVNRVLGGTLRLFVQKVNHGNYFNDREETSLYVNASLPSHATLSQMNGLVQKMEQYISQFPEVRQFQTEIQNARQARIHIRFVKEHTNSSFPHTLKSGLISQSLKLGGGSWSVYGVGDGFNNSVREGAGSFRVEMFGYNYDELLYQAERFKQELLGHRRIREVFILPEFSWYKDDYEEFKFEADRVRLAQEGLQPYQLYEDLRRTLGTNILIGSVPIPAGAEQLYLQARQAAAYHTWDMLHMPVQAHGKVYKLSEFAQVSKSQAPREVAKVNQQYRLCIQYEYIGANEQGKRVQDRYIEEFRQQLPMGYTMKNANPGYSPGGSKQPEYTLLLYILAILYVICSILFNSFRKPLYMIFVIPISFIGIFLSFYLFDVDFDQGGYASFVLLSALTINANIYIIDEYNRIRAMLPSITPLKAYIRASQVKLRPVMLTVISTILGFIPFLVGEGKEAFWFPLAVGTMGGLTVSTLATFLFLPLFMGVGKGSDPSPEKDKRNNQ